MESLDLTDILAFLLTRKSPVQETDLLKRFLPESTEHLSRMPDIALYRDHFTLYHHLGLLASTLESTRYYLHIRLIYIYLFEKPDPGLCSYFDDESVRFCLDPAVNGGRYCEYHTALEDRFRASGTIDIPNIMNFYRNPSNIDVFDQESLNTFAARIFFYAAHYPEVTRSLTVMNLPLGFSLNRLRDRYRYLSKLYHPDLGSLRGEVPFSEITNAYALLSKLKS